LARHWNAALADEGEGSRLRHAGLHADWRHHRLATSGRDRWGGGHSDFDASLSRGGRPRYAGRQKAHWLEWQDWANPVLQRSYEVKDGRLHIPDVPGLGVEWDEKVVAAHPADSF
jgi:L-alanine-DL-glutamate epimerase-like enolase superfamily enzyme